MKPLSRVGALLLLLNAASATICFEKPKVDESFRAAKWVVTGTVIEKSAYGRATIRVLTAFKGEIQPSFETLDRGYRIGESYLIFSYGSEQADMLSCGPASIPTTDAELEIKKLKELAPNRKLYFTLPSRLEGNPRLKPTT
jgi:hypothetical protein